MARNDSKNNNPSTEKKENAGSEKISRGEDIHDSKRDMERLKPDETYIDLPDVKDIPGQEFIHVPRMGEMADTTISSDDEEGVGLFNDDEEDDTLIVSGTEDDVSRTDKVALENMDNLQGADDDEGVTRAELDNTDFEGEELNEEVNTSGSDLDVPGSEGDDKMEYFGGEDEENNHYSRGSDRNDNMNEGTP